MTPAEQIALLRDALEKLLWEANDGYATCPLTREQADAALAATAAPAEHPKPVAWMDEFGNVFPLSAWKNPERASHHDIYKKPWKPLYLAAPKEPTK